LRIQRSTPIWLKTDIMKNLMIVLLLMVPGYLAFSQTKKPSENQEKTRPVTGEKKESPEDKQQTQDNRYTENASGVKRSINYKYSSVSLDGDPGKGIFRYDNDTISKVTFINVNDFDLSGEDQTKWYRTWSDTTGATGRGRINIVEYEGKNVVVFDVRDIFADKDGFWKIPVKYVSGDLPADGKIYFYVFERIENRKDKQNSGEEIKPIVQVKPVEEIKPAVEVKQVEDVKPAVEIKPAEEVKPAVEVKPVEDVKPAVEIKPVEEVKPAVEVKPVEDVKPAVEIKPVEEVKPVVEVKPVEDVKPAVEIKPVEEVKPTVEVKTVEEIKPTDEIKLVEEVKPITGINQEQPDQQATTPRESVSVPVSERTRTATTDRRTQTQTTSAPRTQSTQVRQSTSTIQSKTQATTTNQTIPVKQTQTQAATSTQTSPAKQTQTQTTSPVADKTSQVATQKNTQTETVQRVQPAVGRVDQSITANTQSSFSSSRRKHGKCYSGIIEIGYGAGVTEYGISNFRFNFINGFHIGPTFSLGLGIGVRRYFVKSYSDRTLVSSEIQIPVFFDLRKTFSTRTVTPYVAFGIGSSARYSAQSETTEAVSEGLLLNPSAGIWFNISPRFAVFTGVAYEMQKMEYAKTMDDSHYKKNTSSVSLNVGISF
jgi:hypothetical protein